MKISRIDVYARTYQSGGGRVRLGRGARAQGPRHDHRQDHDRRGAQRVRGDLPAGRGVPAGVTHAPDVATVAPVFHEGELVAWVGASGHRLDIGAIDPGGFSIRAVEVHEEGPRMPAVKIVERGTLRADVVQTDGPRPSLHLATS